MGERGVTWMADYKWGIWWLRCGDFSITLRAPWDKPLFSERNGYNKPMVKFRGWRMSVR